MEELPTMFDLLGFVAPQAEDPIIDPALKDKNVCLSVTAAPPYLKDAGEILASVKKFRKCLEDQGITIVLKQSDLLKPGLKVILNLQSPPPDIDGHGGIDDLFEAGIRICQIGYADVNRYGSGFFNQKIPLTNTGRVMIEKMQETGMILDLAHAGAQTALDSLDVVEKIGIPVMISHTGAYGKYCNIRNAIDLVLQRTVNAGGIIGVLNLTFALSKEDNSPDAFVEHILYVFDNIEGARAALCIGSDGWFCEDKGRWKPTYDRLSATLDPITLMQARFPDQIAEFMSPDKMALIRTGLRARMLKEWDVEAICTTNAARFFAKALPE